MTAHSHDYGHDHRHGHGHDHHGHAHGHDHGGGHHDHAAAAAIHFTGQQWLDPLIGIGIALWVLPRTWSLLRDTTQILLEGVPARLSLAEVRGAIAGADGVQGVHDLHLWSLAGDDASLTAHVVLAEATEPEPVRLALMRMLGDRFAVHHVTLQLEAGPCHTGGQLHA